MLTPSSSVTPNSAAAARTLPFYPDPCRIAEARCDFLREAFPTAFNGEIAACNHHADLAAEHCLQACRFVQCRRVFPKPPRPSR